MPSAKQPTRASSAASPAGTASGSRSRRLGRSDWIEAALTALSDGGLGNVSVERLAGELGATKGSFYWHFKDRPALVAAVLAEWERRDTDRLIERASAIDDPRERLQWLFHVVFADEAAIGIDTALLADVADPVVSAALERVTAKRLRFIETQFKRMGAKDSTDRALLTYTAFVGLGQLRRATPSLTPAGRRSSRYVAHVTDWLLD